MTEEERKIILSQSWKSHSVIESAYLADTAQKGESDWLEKQRYLLADMALHLLQTSLNPGELNKGKLTNNIYSILTIVDRFLPESELAIAKKKLIS